MRVMQMTQISSLSKSEYFCWCLEVQGEPSFLLIFTCRNRFQKRSIISITYKKWNHKVWTVAFSLKLESDQTAELVWIHSCPLEKFNLNLMWGDKLDGKESMFFDGLAEIEFRAPVWMEGCCQPPVITIIWVNTTYRRVCPRCLTHEVMKGRHHK